MINHYFHHHSWIFHHSDHEFFRARVGLESGSRGSQGLHLVGRPEVPEPLLAGAQVRGATCDWGWISGMSGGISGHGYIAEVWESMENPMKNI